MGTGRFSFLLLTLLCLLNPLPAGAGWWFGEPDPWEKSGLDLRQGYDQNTVISVEGSISQIDLEGSGGPALVTLKTKNATMTLVLGPKDYWNQNGIPLQPGEVVSVRGSKAQGKDGQIYLIVQKISTAQATSNGHMTELRNETGRPRWAGSHRPIHQRPAPRAPMRQLRGGNRP